MLAILASTLVLAQTPAPSFEVKVTGKGRPVILIPGLTCPGSVWDETVDHLKGKYQCHVLTLPGFAGRPAVGDPFLPRVRDEIIRYAEANRLDRPAVIGHSLGGFMAFYLASTAPQRFGPIVAVDGVPWLMALNNPKANVEEIRRQVEPGLANMAKMSRDALRPQTLAGLKAQMLDPKRAEAVAKLAGESDPAAVAQAVREMAGTDLRNDIAKIESPILLIVAGEWAKTDAQKETVRREYQAQVAKAPKAQVEYAWSARHFVMFDAPDFFFQTVDRFLEAGWRR